jgi:hypothetical protein
VKQTNTNLQENQRMIHERERKTWIDKIVVCGGGSGATVCGLRRWNGGIDEREEQTKETKTSRRDKREREGEKQWQKKLRESH